MMNIHSALSPQSELNSEQVIDRILSSGKITAADRAWFLKATVSNTTLSSRELMQVRQVFDRLRMGLLKVVD